jgi:hypothetical protein
MLFFGALSLALLDGFDGADDSRTRSNCSQNAQDHDVYSVGEMRLRGELDAAAVKLDQVKSSRRGSADDLRRRDVPGTQTGWAKVSVYGNLDGTSPLTRTLRHPSRLMYQNRRCSPRRCVETNRILATVGQPFALTSYPSYSSGALGSSCRTLYGHCGE